jgi:hypothetical protein
VAVNSSSSSASGLAAQPISTSFGILVLVALGFLILMRHLRGTISIQAG